MRRDATVGGVIREYCGLAMPISHIWAGQNPRTPYNKAVHRDDGQIVRWLMGSELRFSSL
jgi:hypothetical protein